MYNIDEHTIKNENNVILYTNPLRYVLNLKFFITPEIFMGFAKSKLVNNLLNILRIYN